MTGVQTCALPISALSDGGRTLAVTAVAESLAKAKLKAYTAVKEIRWQGAWCRKDISDKAMAYELAAPEVGPGAAS